MDRASASVYSAYWNGIVICDCNGIVIGIHIVVSASKIFI